MHPSLAKLQSLFAAGKLAVLANTGSLVAPITKAQYQAGGSAVPPQLFSHADQQFQWQTGIANSLQSFGWAGRVSDQMGPVNGMTPT